jgi:hypothetical protein
MVNLWRLVANTSAAMSPERSNALTAGDGQRTDDASTRTNAGHGICQAFERCVLSVGDATSLAILAQCVP